MKRILYLSAIIIATGCNTEQSKQVSRDAQSAVLENDKMEKQNLQSFSKEDIARYAISSVMGQPSKSIEVRFANPLYIVSYVRQSDQKQFEYKVKIDGITIVWANIDGRWRDSEYDEKLSFEERDNKVEIIQTFSDGSVDKKQYNKGD